MATLRGVPQASISNTRMETPAAAYYAEQGVSIILFIRTQNPVTMRFLRYWSL